MWKPGPRPGRASPHIPENALEGSGKRGPEGGWAGGLWVRTRAPLSGQWGEAPPGDAVAVGWTPDRGQSPRARPRGFLAERGRKRVCFSDFGPFSLRARLEQRHRAPALQLSSLSPGPPCCPLTVLCGSLPSAHGGTRGPHECCHFLPLTSIPSNPAPKGVPSWSSAGG